MSVRRFWYLDIYTRQQSQPGFSFRPGPERILDRIAVLEVGQDSLAPFLSYVTLLSTNG